MCGITGYFSSTRQVFTNDDLKKMTASLIHRGPDAEGYFFDDMVGLGHRRLSIIDLSEKANQPMCSHNKRFVMVYNGEVYNFREIANDLKTNSPCHNQIKFNTDSDSEIILESFAVHGNAFTEMLNGMFVIAIYDKQDKKLSLFRDRIGIKPLFYYWDGENFAFSSELKSFHDIGSIKKEINFETIASFLHLGYIPDPDSIYKNIFKLEAGSSLTVSMDGIHFHKYWDYKSKISSEVMDDKVQATMKLSDLLISSVQYQMRSDVPLGIFLSGGIDSSLITAHATLLSPEKINTFSIGFEENLFNESEYARKIAKYLGTNHHEFIVSFKEALPLFDHIINTYDEPFADSSAIPAMIVSRLAKKHVTVVLSGEGGDELFMGYGAYRWSRILNNPVVNSLRIPISYFLQRTNNNRFLRASSLFEFPNHNLLKSHIFSQEQYYFSIQELSNLMSDEYSDNLLQSNWLNSINSSISSGTSGRTLNAMENQSFFDLNYYLKGDLLTKVDRASMAYSVETRVPFLDHRIVEFALNLSPKLKINNGISKYILKNILYQYIPEHYFDRKKQGFAIPLNVWLKKELRYLVDDYLNKNIIERINLVKYPEVEKLKKDFFAGRDFLYNRLWLLIILHKFFSEKIHG